MSLNRYSFLKLESDAVVKILKSITRPRLPAEFSNYTEDVAFRLVAPNGALFVFTRIHRDPVHSKAMEDSCDLCSFLAVDSGRSLPTLIDGAKKTRKKNEDRLNLTRFDGSAGQKNTNRENEYDDA